MIRFGVVGLGFMGRCHLATLAGLGGAQVVAVHDASGERLAGPLAPDGGNIDTGGAAWDESAVRRCESLPELLSAGIDAVVLAVPTHLHGELTCAALAAGMHVFCEKPMALDLADCDRMIAAADQAGRVLMIGHCVRFWAEYAAAAEIVRSGRHGRLRSLLMSRYSGLPDFGAGGWFADAGKSGGGLFDLHIHDLDYALMLLGEPAAIRARGQIGPSGGYDHVAASLDYGPDGPVAEIEGGWLAGKVPFRASFRMCLERATLIYDSDRPQLELYADAAEAVSVWPVSGYVAEMQHFVECVGCGSPSEIVPPQSSRQTVAAALAEIRSIRTGRKDGAPLTCRPSPKSASCWTKPASTRAAGWGRTSSSTAT